jgi:hypothetical protein
MDFTYFENTSLKTIGMKSCLSNDFHLKISFNK